MLRAVVASVAVLLPANIGYYRDMSKSGITLTSTGITFKANSVRSKTADAIDIAARYFVYKLYEATDHRPMAWHELLGMREEPATVERAVQRGWVIVREDNSGGIKERSGYLTDEGRTLARRGLRR